jgi:hypothetical protein
MNLSPTGAALFHADRQTDMTKLIVAFHILTKAPKKWKGFTKEQSSLEKQYLGLV